MSVSDLEVKPLWLGEGPGTGAEGKDGKLAPWFGVGCLGVCFENVPETISDGLLCSIYFNWLQRNQKKKMFPIDVKKL